jgi:hypothetical protein
MIPYLVFFWYNNHKRIFPPVKEYQPKLKNKLLALLPVAALALALAFSALPASAQTVTTSSTSTTSTSSSSDVTLVSYATGALSIGRVNGKTVTTTLAGYSGTISGIPSYKWGSATISLNGFIGIGTTTNSGGTTYAVGLYPNIAVGSLALGLGGVYNDTSRKGEILFTASVGINTK